VYNFINVPVKPVEKVNRKGSQLFAIEHFRIAWITFSGLALAVFYLLIRRNKKHRISDSLRGIDEAGN
jgi:choline-glycine betaine transporter